MRYQAPPGATEILLVRHGESQPVIEGEPFPMLNGQGDPALHPNGVVQADRINERLRSLPIDAVYVTSLRRTVQTATPLCESLGLTPQVEPDLREVFLGEWEGGQLRVMAANNHPTFQRLLQVQRWDVIQGAESPETIQARVQGALNRIAQRHPDQLVVAVVHGGVIGHILAEATGARPFSFVDADNGSISRIVLAKDRIVVRSYNDTTHLAS